MSAGDSNYTVGRGKPPLHTRFQKGRSGNPSGKPGPAKLARQRFQRALYAALEAETVELKEARPRGNLDVMARRIALDAAGGRVQAMRLILSELDKEITRGDAAEDVEEEREAQSAAEPPLPDYALWVKANGK
jgi:Family of unknown function (DUF5681)